MYSIFLLTYIQERDSISLFLSLFKNLGNYIPVYTTNNILYL